MLGLATHAPAIVLLREKVVFRSPRADSPNKVSLEGTGEFTLLHVDLLRRYLDLEFRTMVLPLPLTLTLTLTPNPSPNPNPTSAACSRSMRASSFEYSRSRACLQG